MDERLPDAPQRYGFRATPLWAHEQDDLREQLAELVSLDFSGNSPISVLFEGGEGKPRRSVRQEVRFGWDGQRAVEIDGAAGPLRVRGAIDRMDEVDGKLIVIDYKTGNTTIPTKEMIEGRNVQMMLYLAAGQQILPESEVVAGAFWHTGTQKISGNISAQSEEVAEAREALHQRILDGRDGIFVTAPSKRTQGGACAHYCQYRQLCRLDHASGRKAISQSNQAIER
jgi:ATP-dependent helicase/DNAse subunit B